MPLLLRLVHKPLSLAHSTFPFGQSVLYEFFQPYCVKRNTPFHHFRWYETETSCGSFDRHRPQPAAAAATLMASPNPRIPGYPRSDVKPLKYTTPSIFYEIFIYLNIRYCINGGACGLWSQMVARVSEIAVGASWLLLNYEFIRSRLFLFLPWFYLHFRVLCVLCLGTPTYSWSSWLSSITLISL